MTASLLGQKIAGSVLGGAIGNILARPAEGLQYVEIVERLGVLDEPFATINDTLVVGDLGTDENTLALIVAKAYVEKGARITIEDLARIWRRDVNPLHFGDSHQRTLVNYAWYVLRNTYELLSMGCPPRIVGSLNVPANTGMAVVGPVGAFNACDPEQAYHDGVSLAALFQRDRGIVVPGVLAGAVAEALRPGATVDSVVDVAVRLTPSTRQTTALPRRVGSLRETLLEAVSVGHRYSDPLTLRAEAYERLVLTDSLAGDPQEMLGLVFAVFVASRGVTREALIGAANMGRDSDTLAGVLGALCGALNGVASLPRHWLDGFNGLTGAEALLQAADGLTVLAVAQAERRRSAATRILELVGA